MDQLRISDADREEAVELLGEQYAVGRLTRDEFDERSDAVWSARTRGDLAPIFADLPVRSSAGPVRAPARIPAGAPHRPRWWPLPFAPVVIALVLLTALTHVPFILVGLVLWVLLARGGRFGHGCWVGRGSYRPGVPG